MGELRAMVLPNCLHLYKDFQFIFQEIYDHITKTVINDANIPIGRHLPPVAAAFNFSNSLRQRVTGVINNFKIYNQS